MPQAITKFPTLRVLAIEDYMPNMEVLEAMLIDFNCDFEIVDNNTDALELHANRPFDVILMDILVPDFEGDEIVEKIRKIPGPAGRVHIIAITGNASLERPSWMRAGIDQFLRKPLKIRDLEQSFLNLHPKKGMRCST